MYIHIHFQHTHFKLYIVLHWYLESGVIKLKTLELLVLKAKTDTTF